MSEPGIHGHPKPSAPTTEDKGEATAVETTLPTQGAGFATVYIIKLEIKNA